MDIHRRSQTADPDLHRRVCADAAKALRRFRRDGDDLWEARLLFNRGLLHLDRGELDLAEADVVRARMLYVRAGAETAVSNVVPVVAGIAALRGEIVTCLKVLDELDGTVLPGQLGYNLAQSRVVALMQARLLPEARAACEAYIDLCSRTGGGEFVASALLDLAAIALMSGDAVSARRFATNSARSFAARRKPVDAALARAVVLRAALAEGGVGRSAVRSGLAAASVLESAGWRVEALRTRLLVVRLALMAGSTSRKRSPGTEPSRTESAYATPVGCSTSRRVGPLTPSGSSSPDFSSSTTTAPRSAPSSSERRCRASEQTCRSSACGLPSTRGGRTMASRGQNA